MRNVVKTWRSRISFLGSLGVVLLLVAAPGCSLFRGADEPPSASSAAVSSHLDLLAQTAAFTEVPPFATRSDTGRRDECHEPDFERREPTVWVAYTYTGPAAEVLDFYDSRLASDGWTRTDEVGNPGGNRAVRYERSYGDWTGAIIVSVDVRPGLYQISAEDATTKVCPVG